MVGHDPLGGEPMAVAKASLGAGTGTAVELRPSQADAAPETTGAINPPEAIAQLKAQERAKEKALDQAAAGRGEQIVTIIDGRSGARQEVKIPAPVEATISQGIDAQLVEITRDGGRTWSAAKLAAESRSFAWRLWTAELDLPAGHHELAIRATDSRGNTMPGRGAWNLKGYLYNGWHRIGVEVA
jgi:hypothetical protein